MANARITFTGELNANGAINPGIGDAVPGALHTIPSRDAPIPAIPPPKKLDPWDRVFRHNVSLCQWLYHNCDRTALIP